MRSTNSGFQLTFPATRHALLTAFPLLS